MGAYMLWLGEERQKIKAENPGISITELTKLAGERWKGLGDKSVRRLLCIVWIFLWII